MKNEKEFLEDVWEKVGEFEYEEMQKEIAKKINHQISFENGVIYGLFLLSFLVLAWVVQGNMTYSIIFGSILLSIGYFVENFLWTVIEKGTQDENRDYNQTFS